ncbi:retrovirus-related pol polyprotein LINE-1 [Tanacetum coccineum]
MMLIFGLLEALEMEALVDAMDIDSGNLRACMDCRAFPSKACSSQHRLVTLDVLFERQRQRRAGTERPRILWKNLNGDAVETFRATVSEKLSTLGEDLSASDANQMWNTLACCIKDAAKDSVGVTRESSRTRSSQMESWWFSEEVQTKIAVKQDRFKELLLCHEGNQEDRAMIKERYKVAKREAKIAVTQAKDKAYEDLYKKLDSKEGENDIYRIAKARERKRRDLGNIRYIKDEEGRTIMIDKDIRKRWGEYFSSLFNERRPEGSVEVENSSQPLQFDCYYSRINQREVRAALQKMGRNKAIFSSAKMPDEWRLSEVIPIYKNKGYTQYRERQRDLHMAFLDLEKAYDSVSRELIWRTLINKGTPRRYLRVIKDMYDRAKTCVRISMGNTEFFPVEVGLHQGSSISPYLFALILDELSRGIQENIPWSMVFADDIVYEAAHGKEGIIGIRDQILQPKESFRYLGSVIHRSGRIDKDVTHRIRTGWMKWRAKSGNLYDKRVPLKLKGKFYRVAIRPTMLYGSECLSITKAQANRVEVAELRMLRWTCGKTMLDMIPNGVFRAELEVESIIHKMREGRLRWFGHVKRRPQTAPVRRVEALFVDGLRRRGRPKLRWEDRLKQDMKELLLSEDMTSDRNAWRDRISIGG